jgi:ABC-type transport system involved in multi-copper enzyme maturation permease subunit
MVAKELIEARWKALIGLVLGVATILLGAFGFELMRSALSPEQIQSIGNALGREMAARFSNYGNFVWGQAFNPSGNNGVILLVVAALLGSTAIAGEVSKGTIFLLLSRPLSRDNVLLTKYAVGAIVLLAMLVVDGLVLAVATAIEGDPQHLGGIAVSVLLYWLGTLFVLGISTLLSVVFNDVLRPLALTLGVVLLLSLPGLLPQFSEWVLPGYWSSLPAFLGQEFPLKALLVSAVAAAIPAILAVPLFRRQAY